MPEVHGSTGATATDIQSFDNPEAYIPGDRRRALASGVEMPDRLEGSALFADISGFTPLTEALANELGSQRGSEELTATLNRVFHAIIAELDRYGGDVIYFSGDAITCWIAGDDGARATHAASRCRARWLAWGRSSRPAGSTIQLAMKIAVAVGKARRFLVGDPDIQLIDVLAGRLIDDLAAAEHYAEKGEVVLDQSALESLGERVEILAERADEERGTSYGVVGRLTVEVAETPAASLEEPLDEDVVAEWLLPAVYERIRTGRGEFLAELRPAFPVFVRFAGIDYDEDDHAIDKLDDFVRRAQRIFDSYGGNLLQLTLGDKGAYLYAVFGSPHAHEDDAARAAAAALDVRALEQTTAATGIQIGITHGRLRSGTYGHELRRTFVCLGDAVNLAARLMSKAPPGQIYVSEPVHRGAGAASPGRTCPTSTVKGKAGHVAAHALIGAAARRHHRRQTRYRLPMFGRDAELELLGANSTWPSPGRARGRNPGRGRDGEVATRRRLSVASVAEVRWSLSASARRTAAIPATSRGARFGGRCSISTTTRRRRSQLARLEAELAAIDPELVAALAVARACARPFDPRQRPHAGIRRQAAEGVPRGPARRVPAGTGRTAAAGSRARGLPLARRALP